MSFQIQNNISFVKMFPYSYIVDSGRWHIQNCGETSVKAMCIGLPLHTDVTGSNWKTSNQTRCSNNTCIWKVLEKFSFKRKRLQSFQSIRISWFFLLYEEVLRFLQNSNRHRMKKWIIDVGERHKLQGIKLLFSIYASFQQKRFNWRDFVIQMILQWSWNGCNSAAIG